MLVSDLLIDMIFICDIIIIFRTTFYNNFGIEVSDPKEIAIHYLKGKFTIDLLSSLPLDVVLKFATGSERSYFSLFSCLKIIRVLKLSVIIKRMNIKEEYKSLFNLFKLIFFTILYLHIIGCYWFWLTIDGEYSWIAPPLYFWPEGSQNIHLPGTPLMTKYQISLYCAVLMTTGNDVNPITTI
jgi:hypothetical protein